MSRISATVTVPGRELAVVRRGFGAAERELAAARRTLAERTSDGNRDPAADPGIEDGLLALQDLLARLEAVTAGCALVLAGTSDEDDVVEGDDGAAPA